MPDFDPLEMSFTEFATNDAGDETDPVAESDDEPETEQPDSETDAEPEAQAEEEAQADGDVALLDDELRELGYPELPPELASDPGTHKRWLEMQTGAKNMVDAVKPYYKYVKALEDPATQAAAFEELFKATGYRPQGVQAPEAVEPEASADDFEYDGERIAYERARRDAVADMERKYGPLLGQFEAQQKQTLQEREFTSRVDKEAPAVIGYFGKAEGFPVTKDMVAQAMRKHPGDDVIHAVKMAHLDAFIAHKAGKPARQGPEMPTGSGATAKGMALPNISPEDYADLTADQIRNVHALLPD